jgi:methionine-rich copper-binding protein CopC
MNAPLRSLPNEENFMKRLIAIALAATGILTAAVWAQDTKVPSAPSKTAGAATSPGTGTLGQMTPMDEQMKKMQLLHDQMSRTTTPEERRKLMEEQRKAMQEGMGMMDKPGGVASRMQMMRMHMDMMEMMQTRMDMMQLMMQAMMDQQGMMAGPSSPNRTPKK